MMSTIEANLAIAISDELKELAESSAARPNPKKFDTEKENLSKPIKIEAKKELSSSIKSAEKQIQNGRLKIAQQVELIKKAALESLIGSDGQDYDVLVDWLGALRKKELRLYLDFIKHILPKSQEIDHRSLDTETKAPLIIAINNHPSMAGNPQEVLEAKVG